MPQFVLGYVYQLGDFSTTGGHITPPNEQGARAQGKPPFNIKLKQGSTPLRLLINDADNRFHETAGTDPLQALAQAVTIDGVTYPAGSHVVLNYVLTDNNGFEGFSITIGSTNSGNNTTTAFISNQPMVPGQTYVFTSEKNIGNNNHRPYSEFACFVAGTRLQTPTGLRPIETLRPGDLVLTEDAGMQTARWVGQRSIPGRGAMAPILFEPGTLGATRPLLVSPNHRMLIQGAVAELLFGCDRVLAAAKHLVNDQSIRRAPCDFVTYAHVMFDRHQIISAHGCLSESFYIGDTSSKTLNKDQRQEILSLFPELESKQWAALACREAKSFEAGLIGKALAA